MCVCSFIHAFNIYVSSSRLYAFGEEAASEPQTLLLEPKSYIGWKGKDQEFERGEREKRREEGKGGEGRGGRSMEQRKEASPSALSPLPLFHNSNVGRKMCSAQGVSILFYFLFFQLTSILV